MRKFALTTLSLAALAAPAPLLAQEADVPPLEPVEGPETDLAEKFADPDYQRQTALMVRTMAEVLLDLPLAPVMEAAGDVAGEDAPDVDPDATLRSLAPGASRVPEEIERNLPRAMQAMGSMADAFEAMKPALRDMAERLKEALPEEQGEGH
jgi:hypothetical protein